MSPHNSKQRGFTIIEVLVAAVVLAIGMLSAALLMTNVLINNERSKYMSAASVLAVEKMEDLSRWPATAPQVAVLAGSTAGSLNGDLTANVIVAGASTTVAYFDDISFSVGTGTFSESVSAVDGAGNPGYATTTHAPDGTVITEFSGDPPARINFKRRWLIERDTPVAGVRRITVRVELIDNSVQPPPSFQISTVRP